MDIEKLKEENETLRCIMYAAAQELLQNWERLTFEGGYGPTQLLKILLGEIKTNENPYPQYKEAIKRTE